MSGQYCLFKEKSLRDILPPEVITAKRDGVMGSVVGAISCMASTYLIEYLTGKKKSDILVSFKFNDNQVSQILI